MYSSPITSLCEIRNRPACERRASEIGFPRIFRPSAVVLCRAWCSSVSPQLVKYSGLKLEPQILPQLLVGELMSHDRSLQQRLREPVDCRHVAVQLARGDRVADPRVHEQTSTHLLVLHVVSL